MWERRKKTGSLTNMWNQIRVGTGQKVRKVMPEGQKSIKVKND